MDMSLPWAEFISFWSNWFLIGALVVGVLATYGIVVSSNVKEDHLKADIAHANERTAQSELELARIKAPRRLKDEEAFLKALEKIPPPANFKILYLKEDQEAMGFGLQLLIVLNLKAHWPAGIPPLVPISEADAVHPDVFKLVPSTSAIGAQQTGVSLLTNQIDESKGTPLLDALQKAFGVGGIAAYRGQNAMLPDNVVWIVVGPKPL